jgi:hypothetical protein
VSIWNRIGDIATTIGKLGVSTAPVLSVATANKTPFQTVKNVAKFGGEVLSAAGSSYKLAWDLGTAAWNDSEEYSGFSNTIKSSYEKNVPNIVKPLASAGGAVMKVPGLQPTFEFIDKINREYIREPLTTAGLVLGDVKSGKASFFDPNEWKKAYGGAQDISYGQAVLGFQRSWYDPKFNIYDPREREAAFEKSFWGKTLSGSYDLGIQFFGDVTLVAGKGIKVVKASELAQGVLKNADTVAKAAEDITKAQYGVKNRFTPVIDNFTKNDSVYALNHPIVKTSSQPGLLAHLLGQSASNENTALILRSALGDPAALDELALMRADMSDALKAARGDLSVVDEYNLFANADETGMIPFINDDIAVINAAQENYKALAQSDDYFAKLMGLGEGGGALTRTTGPLARGLDNFLAESRAMKFYDRTVGKPKIEAFQPTPFHLLYQKVTWLAGERPSGIVNFNDPDSYKEVLATIGRIERLLPVNPSQSKAMLDDYIGAATPEERALAVTKLESTVVRSLAQKHNISEEVADDLYNNYGKARTSALKSIQDRGFMVDVDGSIVHVPQLESQSGDFLPVMDFDLLDSLLKREKNSFNALVGKGKHGVLTVADFTQDLFKAGALLRLGYTVRNGIDSQLRIAASVGAMATLQHLGPGLKHLINNTVAVPARMIDRYLPVNSNMTIKNVQRSHTDLMRELTILKKEIGEVEAKLSLDPDSVALEGKLNTLKIIQEEKESIYNHYSEVLNRYSDKAPKQRIGTGSFSITTTDGRVFELPDAFGGPLGDMYRKLASSGNTFQRLVEQNSAMYARKLESKGIKAVRPTDPAYFDQWAQTLRQQFGNSAIARKLAAGEPLEDIAQWLRNSPEGRDLRKRLSLTSSQADEYVTRISGYLDQYLPKSSGLRGKMREVTASDLRGTFTDPTELPIIHGHLLEEAVQNTSSKNVQKVINTLFHFLGTLPEDTWARNPLYIHLYRKEAERRVKIMAGLKGDKFSFEDQEKLMGIAHKVAQRQMKEILFNIERRSNLAAALKFISPFFSAQENAYKTWLKLVAANPQIANRGYMVWQAPNKAGLVTDQDGNEVPAGQTSGNDVIWVGIPKGLQRIPGLSSLTEMGIPKQSLDIVFQGGMDVLYNKGNPNVFSDIFPVGPYVAIPVSELVKRQPKFEEAFKWALPYGAYKDAVSGLTPAWFQKLQKLQAGQDDPQFANSYQLIYNTEQMKAKRNGRPPVPESTILRMTQDYWKLRVAANLIMPFAPRFESPYKFYLDKSREYKRKFGYEADSRFLEDYPDFFEFTTSLSSNPTGIQYSINAVENVKKYGDVITKLKSIDPKLIGLVTNDPSGYQFSSAAYDYLYNKRVSPNSPDKFLESQDPGEAQKKNAANKGWIKYNKFSDFLDAALLERGLTSIQESGAEDLAMLKAAVVNQLSIKTDAEGKPIINEKTGTFEPTAWALDYRDSDGAKTDRVISGLNALMEDKKFWPDNKNKPMWKSTEIYLQFRQGIAAELSARPVKSIDAKANKDLRILYDGVVNKLKKDDPTGFAYLYDRFLSQDLVYDKYLTPKGTK